MPTHKGKLLSVEENPTKDGKARFKVMIDTDEKGLTEFTLWDLGYVGGGENPQCDIREMIGWRVIFEAKLGGHKKDKDGNELEERWPSTLTLIQAETPEAPADPVRQIAANGQLKAAMDDLLAAIVFEIEAKVAKAKEEIFAELGKE